MWFQFTSLHLKSVPFVQSYYEITSNSYLTFIRNYVIGIGPWKDTIVPPKDNCLGQPTDLVARAHALNLQVTAWSYLTAADFAFPIGQISFLPLYDRTLFYSVSSCWSLKSWHIAGASIHFQKWEPIPALRFPSRPLCWIWVLAQRDGCGRAVHWFHRQSAQVPGMDYTIPEEGEEPGSTLAWDRGHAEEWWLLRIDWLPFIFIFVLLLPPPRGTHLFSFTTLCNC